MGRVYKYTYNTYPLYQNFYCLKDIMNSLIYDEIVERKKSKQPRDHFWPELAKEYGFSSPEALRSSYRRHKQHLGGATREEKAPQNIKILILDIETSPLVCFSWGIYDQKILPENVIYDWFIFSYAAKWLFDENIISNVLTTQETSKRKDKRIVKEIWELINEADIVITYNGDHFDFRKINTRFVLYQLPPPSFYRSVDLYKVAKDNFNITSNKLSFVNTFLGIEDKTSTGFDLWKRCWNGEQEALEELRDYNCNDSKITEMLYLKILPWIKNHPNIGVYSDENIQVCPKCGSQHILWDGKFYYTQLAKYDTFRCSDCNSIGRARKNLLSTEKNKSLIR